MLQQSAENKKVSDFGKKIRYIPLETNDYSLVGNRPNIKVLRNFIIIESGGYRFNGQGNCLLFNKENGHFIAEIGHYGQDPSAFTNNFSWTDDKEEFLYFERYPNQLIKYDMKGNFCGKVEFAPPGLALYYLITNSEIIGYFNDPWSTSQYILGFYDKDGILKDTIPPLAPIIELERGGVAYTQGGINNSYFKGVGIWSLGGTFSRSFNNIYDLQLIFGKAPRIWKNNENIRFKADFVDTLYTITESNLIPAIVFFTGKYHWPIEEQTKSAGINNNRIFIAAVSEINDFVFFQCVSGLLPDGPRPNSVVLYNGLYNKETGETKLSKHGEGIEDDINHFMPFTPLGISSDGEFVSMVEAWSVMEWFEKHPEALNNENLSFLEKFDEEMNPIVILLE